LIRFAAVGGGRSRGQKAESRERGAGEHGEGKKM